MKSTMSVIYIVCLGLLNYLAGRVSCCNIAAVSNCTQLLQSNTDIRKLNEGIAAIPTSEQLQLMCRNITEFKACYEPEAALCQNDVVFSMTFGTIEKTVDYLCIEGKQDILKYDSCWNQSTVAEDTTMCHLQQTQMLRSLKDEAGGLSPADLQTVWCQILENTTTCMTDAVERRCGAGAQCVMQTMMSRSLDGLAKFMKCPTPLESCTISTTELVPNAGNQTISKVTTTLAATTTTTEKNNEKGQPEDLNDHSAGSAITNCWKVMASLLLLTYCYITSMH